MDITTATHTHEHDGRTFYFCNPRCKTRFAANPQQFLDSDRRAAAAAKLAARPAAGVRYTWAARCLSSNAGMDDHLSKPYSSAELTAMLAWWVPQEAAA